MQKNYKEPKVDIYIHCKQKHRQYIKCVALIACKVTTCTLVRIGREDRQLFHRIKRYITFYKRKILQSRLSETSVYVHLYRIYIHVHFLMHIILLALIMRAQA